MNLIFSNEIKEAKKNGKPIVALESTIISHGMPYPKNLQTAKEIENIIRENGAIPATIAILDGNVHIGLNDEQLELLANSPGRIEKCSKRDIPIIIGLKKNGATTVAATMYFAKLAGIEVFVTGGIGGVHRGYDKILDISNDLEELSLSNVIVVCAGVKSILDIKNTLEYLETKGVPVLTYNSDYFPSFFNSKSYEKTVYKFREVEEIEKIWRAKKEIQLNGGLLIANPIKKEDEFPKELIDKAIEKGLKEAENKGIKGKNITPFLLEYINIATNGESLKSNIKLVKNNAILGSQIAVAINKK